MNCLDQSIHETYQSVEGVKALVAKLIHVNKKKPPATYPKYGLKSGWS